MVLCCLFFFFFFSSRRRHTRCSRDWSSDVCSSDLELEIRERPERRELEPPEPHAPSSVGSLPRRDKTKRSTSSSRLRTVPRSEERRVGKEWRSRGSP